MPIELALVLVSPYSGGPPAGRSRRTSAPRDADDDDVEVRAPPASTDRRHVADTWRAASFHAVRHRLWKGPKGCRTGAIWRHVAVRRTPKDVEGAGSGGGVRGQPASRGGDVGGDVLLLLRILLLLLLLRILLRILLG